MEKSIIVISAVWCPSCLILNKHLKKIKENYDIKITKLDYDFDDIEEYNVGDKLPVIILKDKNDNEIKRLIGEKSYQEIVDFLEV
ncbi:MAG: thioredoxin family protein [Bacilli bacterium]|nr:thioredoxin family protein [Bacilli bacterium]